MSDTPISPFEETLGMIYFARMIDKIRKHAAGQLRADFTDNLGIGFDRLCCGTLGLSYEAVRARTLEGGHNEEVLRWCYANGRELSQDDLLIWNEFLRKRGWNDAASALLARRKQESGLGDRADIQTMLEYMEYDEGRKA